MSVLVTGGAGYIGSHTTLLLLENGYDVITLDNLSNSTNESLKRVERLTNKKIKQYTGDILNSELLNRIFGENNITDVIHFAGLKSVSESINDPIKYYKNNVVGSLTLVSEMVKHKVTNIIFSSSATVYGQPEIIPLTEDCKTEKPTNPYGYSKLVVENILRDLVKSSHDFNVTCLRYFNPVGAHPSGEIGENPNGVPSNIMPYISGVAIGKYKQLNIYGSDYNTPDGTGIRDYIHVMDLAEGHLCALRKKWSTPSFRIYNLGTGKGYS
ncbi:UDP-glucose 4-epimerase GalE, partial [Escherichia coli]|nr:UDP-glucose 4-epimerase GalE [Escherichia coli]